MRACPSLALSLWTLLASPLLAQYGNLAAEGQLDDATDFAAWELQDPFDSSASFDAADDADGCTLSGSLDGTGDTQADFGAVSFRLCLGSFPDSAAYTISGDFLFPPTSPDARANLTLAFYAGSDCTEGTVAGGLFAGYALSSVSGWQHVQSGGSFAQPAGAASAGIKILLTQISGSGGVVEVIADNVRVVPENWIFAEDFEVADSCRWSSALP